MKWIILIGLIMLSGVYGLTDINSCDCNGISRPLDTYRLTADIPNTNNCTVQSYCLTLAAGSTLDCQGQSINLDVGDGVLSGNSLTLKNCNIDVDNGRVIEGDNYNMSYNSFTGIGNGRFRPTTFTSSFIFEHNNVTGSAMTTTMFFPQNDGVKINYNRFDDIELYLQFKENEPHTAELIGNYIYGSIWFVAQDGMGTGFCPGIEMNQNTILSAYAVPYKYLPAVVIDNGYINCTGSDEFIVTVGPIGNYYNNTCPDVNNDLYCDGGPVWIPINDSRLCHDLNDDGFCDQPLSMLLDNGPGANGTYVDNYAMSSLCITDWRCTNYGTCAAGNQPCLAVTDFNNCGTTFTGNLNDYDRTCTTGGGGGAFPEAPPALAIVPELVVAPPNFFAEFWQVFSAMLRDGLTKAVRDQLFLFAKSYWIILSVICGLAAVLIISKGGKKR